MKDCMQVSCNMDLRKAEFFRCISFSCNTNTVGWNQITFIIFKMPFLVNPGQAHTAFSSFAPPPPKRKNSIYFVNIFSKLWLTLYLPDTFLGVHLSVWKKNYDKISFRHLIKKSQQFDHIFPGQMTSPPPAGYLVIEIIGCYHWSTWKHKWCIQLLLPASAE